MGLPKLEECKSDGLAAHPSIMLLTRGPGGEEREGADHMLQQQHMRVSLYGSKYTAFLSQPVYLTFLLPPYLLFQTDYDVQHGVTRTE